MSRMKDELIKVKAAARICSSLICLSVIALTSCGPLPKDYDAIAKCGNMGFKIGTPAYDECVEQETRSNLLERRRKEIEREREQQDRERIFRRVF